MFHVIGRLGQEASANHARRVFDERGTPRQCRSCEPRRPRMARHVINRPATSALALDAALLLAKLFGETSRWLRVRRPPALVDS